MKPRPFLLRAIALLALCVAPALAQAGRTTAADVTEPWRGLAHFFDRILPPDIGKEDDGRTIALVLDPTQALRTSGFEAAFAAALERHAAALGKTRYTVHKIGDDKPLLVASEDPAAAKDAVAKALAVADERMKNVYAELRDIIGPVATRSGEKTIVLATLDNGDAEDDVEATAARVRGAGVRLHILAAEAYVADSWWAARPFSERPKDTTLWGGDSAVIDLPWGWVFQNAVANEVTPSGWACWGLSRLAAATGGKVHVYSAANAGRHECAPYAACLFCAGDHIAPDEVYSRAKLVALAPSVASRSDAVKELQDDPWFRATLDAWNAGLKAGLLSGAPPKGVEATGTDSAASGRLQLYTAANAARNASKAETGAKDAERILQALDADLAKLDPNAGTPRQRAIAEFTRLMLRVTRTNLLAYAAWARELAPQFGKEHEYEAPEIPWSTVEGRASAVGWLNRTLCHGAAPFLAVEVPGKDLLRPEILALQSELDGYMQKHANGPWAFAIHREGLAYFHIVPTGNVTEQRVRPKAKTGTEAQPKTGGTRPSRGGSGSGSGPRTGG